MEKVEVRWTDSGTFYGEQWQHADDVPRLRLTQISEVATIGFIIGEDERSLYIGLSHTLPEDDSVSVYGVQTILKDNIKSVHRLSFMSDETSRYRIPRVV